jgi:glycosyl transferase family 11
MITMLLQGGHGNQLFQWAFGMAQAKRLGVKLQLNTSKLGGARPYSLNQWTAEKIEVPYYVEPTVREQGMPYNPTLANSIKNGDVIQGYFQSEKYFTGIEADLVALRPRVTNNALLENIFNTFQPVAVHVRRGDYLREPHKSFHGNLGLDYYREAMRYVSNRVRRAKFFIFSDDPQWCRDRFDTCTIVEPTEEASDIHSISLCKHSIIANSSFSWWGAYLGKKDRVVVAPKNWFQSMEEDARDVVPERWTKI